MFQRSLYGVQVIRAGTVITAKQIRSIRLGYGLAPIRLNNVIGARARQDIASGQAYQWDLIEGDK